jgi:hypothetical protein
MVGYSKTRARAPLDANELLVAAVEAGLSLRITT